MNEIKDAAQKYLNRGWQPVPLHPGSKGAIGSGWQKRKYTADDLSDFKVDQNIGIRLGEDSGWLVDIDLDTDESIYAGEKFLPHTLKSQRGAKISHYWYVAEGAAGRKAYVDPFEAQNDKKTLLEFRANQQTVVEPSTHPTGDSYTWLSHEDPLKIDVEDLRTLCHKIATTCLIARVMPDSGRHDFALHLAGYLSKNLSQGEVEDIMVTAWEIVDAPREGLKDAGDAVETTFDRIENGENVTGAPKLEEYVAGLASTLKEWWGWKSTSQIGALSEIGNARRMQEDHGDDIHYVHEWKKWIYWTGRRWDVDTVGRVYQLMMELTDTMLAEAADMPEDKAKAALAHAHKSRTESAITSAIKLARTLEGVTISSSQLDNPLKTKYLLTCKNGTYNFETGELMPHNKKDYITKLANVNYNENAKAPRWEKFMEEILPDPAVRDYVEQALGYSISGDTGERSVFIAEGRGRNGKSTMLETVLEIIDEYGTVASTEVFLEKRGGGGPNNDVAALRGSYLVKASEIDQGRKLSEALIKNLAGGQDKVAARYLYGEYFEFDPTFKIWILTNALPRISGTDDAIWDRIKILPFTERIQNIDKNLSVKLRREHEGIFYRLLQAYHRYQAAGGLVTPKAVRDRVNKHRKKQDNVLRFVLEKCEYAGQAVVSSLYEAYNSWTLDEGEYRPAKKEIFKDRLEDMNLQIEREGREDVVKGLRLNDGTDGAGPPDSGNDAMDRDKEESSTQQYASEVVVAREAATPENRDEGIDAAQTDVGLVPYPSSVGEEPSVVAGDAKYAPTYKEGTDLSATTHDLTRKLDVVAIDVETTGLDPHHDRIKVLAVYEAGETTIHHITEGSDPIRLALEELKGKSLVGHNIAFDLSFLRENYGFVPSGPVFDTMVLSQMAYAGLKDRKHGLDACVLRELNVQLSKAEQKSDWSVPQLTPEQRRYVEDDVRHLPDLLVALLQRTKNNSQLVELELNLLPVLVDMKSRGVGVDMRQWRAAVDTISLERDEIDAQLTEYDKYGPWTTYKRKQNYQMPVNWNSPKQVLDVFKAEDVHIGSTKDDVLAGVDHPLADMLRRRRKLNKIVTSYGESWLAHVAEDNRVHPTWKQTSTDTGRMSCADPNMQQIPRPGPASPGGKLRQAIKADEGNVLVVADYSQIELRIAAKLAGERKMLDAYKRGDDLHTLTAKLITGKKDVDKNDRQLAKAVNFGLLYGMGADKLKRYAKQSYGVSLSRDDAFKYRNNWFAAYPAIREWHNRVGAEQDDSRATGEVPHTRTYAGRVRYGVGNFTEHLNTPIQGSGADGLKFSLLRAGREGLYPVLVIHDEIVVETAAEGSEEVAGRLKSIMEEEMYAAVNVSGTHVPIEVEVTVSREWAKP